MNNEISKLKIKLFADGAEIDNMIEMASMPHIAGLTTNPTLMRKAGVSDYQSFAKSVLKEITQKPVSFEVFSDELDEMERQANTIASWGENVYIKIPITNTLGHSTSKLIGKLAKQGIKVNVTAVFSDNQVLRISEELREDVPSYVSIFAGRIADTGIDPVPIVKRALSRLSSKTSCEVIWASPRELLNVFQANDAGCHIITATSDVLAKLNLVGKDLDDYSLDTVKMFYSDAQKSGYLV
jgi:transaldolase